MSLVLSTEKKSSRCYNPDILPPDRAQGAPIVRVSDLISEGCGLPFLCHAMGDVDTCIHLHLLIIYLSFL